MKRIFLLLIVLLIFSTSSNAKNSDLNTRIDSIEMKMNDYNRLLTISNSSIEKNKKDIEDELKIKNDVIDYKKDSVSWWLTVIAVLVATFGVFIPIGISLVGFVFGRKLYVDINKQKTDVDDEILKLKKEAFEIAKVKDEAERYIIIIKNYEQQGKGIIDDTMIFMDKKKNEVDDLTKYFDSQNNQTESVLQATKKSPEEEKENLKSNVQQAYDFYLKKEYSKAIPLYQNIINDVNVDNKERLETYFFLAFCCAVIGKENLAFMYYSKLLELNPNYSSAYLNRGVLYYNKNKYNDAIKDYNKSIELNSTAIGYNNRGSAYQQLREYDLAILDFNKSIEIDLFYFNAYKNRGVTYRLKNDFEMAIADLNTAAELKEDDGEVYYNRAMCYTKMYDYENAIINYEKCKNLYHDNVSLLLNLAEVQIMNNDVLNARETLNTCSRLTMKEKDVFSLKLLSMFADIIQNKRENTNAVFFESFKNIKALKITWSFGELEGWLKSTKSDFVSEQQKEEIDGLIQETKVIL